LKLKLLLNECMNEHETEIRKIKIKTGIKWEHDIIKIQTWGIYEQKGQK
jgi:hypothetical protein